MSEPKYLFFVAYDWESKAGFTGKGNCPILFESPIMDFQQVLDAQASIKAQDPRFDEITISNWIFMKEVPVNEGMHESGPEQEEDDVSGPAGTPRQAGAVHGRRGESPPQVGAGSSGKGQQGAPRPGSADGSRAGGQGAPRAPRGGATRPGVGVSQDEQVDRLRQAIRNGNIFQGNFFRSEQEREEHEREARKRSFLEEAQERAEQRRRERGY